MRTSQHVAFLVLLWTIGCTTLPPANLQQNDLSASTEIVGDTLWIHLSNPAPIPSRMVVSSRDATFTERVSARFDIGAASDTSLGFDIADLDTAAVKSALSFSYTLGSLATPVEPVPLDWPFPRGRSYQIIQGYNGSFSHQSPYSRYALDFNLAEGDTIAAADDGFVVGVIEGYDVGGNDRKYRPYANYITLFHPLSGVITQYVHLEHEGSLVAVGDTVKRGQPIGMVGLTGFTSTEHLHFNVLIPDSTEGMVSIPITFSDETPGASLTRGSRVSH